VECRTRTLSRRQRRAGPVGSALGSRLWAPGQVLKVLGVGSSVDQRARSGKSPPKRTRLPPASSNARVRASERLEQGPKAEGLKPGVQGGVPDVVLAQGSPPRLA
jgi:hypothetical protein